MTFRALSLKQPWAALLAAGRKTVEVRRWATAYRGPLLIHAARVPDPRDEAWAHVPPDLAEAARLGRGIVGAGALTDCLRYPDPEAFAADRHRHLNDPRWFEPAGLYGLCFTQLRPLPFRPAPGWLRIFEIDLDDLEGLDAPPPPVPAPPARPRMEELPAPGRIPPSLRRQPPAGRGG